MTILSLVPAASSAQDASSAAAAESLFREGRQLMDARRYSEACPKFQASFELDVALGTLLNLANCYELDGQLASAWARFVEAETMARRAGDHRGQVARDRAHALEPRLVRVRVVVPAPVPGLRVVVGTREFGAALFGSAIPVDPGELTLTASAPRHETFTRTIDARTEGTTVDVEVPALVPAPEAAVEEESPRALRAPTPQEEPGAGRTVGFVVGGLGLGSLVVATVFGVNANALWDPSACPVGTDGVRRCSTASAQDDAEAARRRAHVSTTLFSVGGALVVTGIVLVATSGGGDSDGAARVVVAPMAQRDGGGLVVGGSF